MYMLLTGIYLLVLVVANSNLTHTECFIEVKPGEDITYFLDAVIDSSRYYVLRLKDRSSDRQLLMGIYTYIYIYIYIYKYIYMYIFVIYIYLYSCNVYVSNIYMHQPIYLYILRS
jgi:hypothetical protein